ncbi:unnamed protein product [Gongylonema pulchrum]|uniref:DDE_Tnp_1_7 domain-containing protein n=1 Tax=Gongylonema pulchrum TaxID=637853 RepID=A0A183EVH7_9BILA|nr:unnamed protein product [Gongylonema pulchrum]
MKIAVEQNQMQPAVLPVLMEAPDKDEKRLKFGPYISVQVAGSDSATCALVNIALWTESTECRYVRLTVIQAADLLKRLQKKQNRSTGLSRTIH